MGLAREKMEREQTGKRLKIGRHAGCIPRELGGRLGAKGVIKVSFLKVFEIQHVEHCWHVEDGVMSQSSS